jgi:hypothetical protein
MQSTNNAYVRYVKSIAIGTVMSVCGLQPLIAQTAIPEAGFPEANSVESQARHTWRKAMSDNPASTEGCFHATYPSLVWESVACGVGELRVRPTARTSPDGMAPTPDVIGTPPESGGDYALQANGLITAAEGLFATKNVTSEKGVGVAAYGGSGILGPNEFTLQLNSNRNRTTSACQGHSGCTVWQQYLYGPDQFKTGQAGVFIQYWLLGWGTKACPAGWGKSTNSCYRNSAHAIAPDLKITDLENMALVGKAAAGGNDVVTFYNGTEAYSVTAKDTVLDLGTVWHQAEFNVVGNAGGSRADFNSGASIFVVLEVNDGSTAVPTCLIGGGSTGESNNLYLDPCLPTHFDSNPAIEFIEFN